MVSHGPWLGTETTPLERIWTVTGWVVSVFIAASSRQKPYNAIMLSAGIWCERKNASITMLAAAELPENGENGNSDGNANGFGVTGCSRREKHARGR